MRGASFADLHLGFRSGSTVRNGRNLRELDVEAAWLHAVRVATNMRPDLVTIAGDIFHHPRVSTHAVKAFLDGIQMFSTNGIPVIILQGNHDAAKTPDVLTPIVLADRFPGVYVVTEPRRIHLAVDGEPGLVSITCLPFVSRGNGATYTLEPDPDASLNVLVLHAPVKSHGVGDQLPHFYSNDQAIDIGRHAKNWDVIAAGDFHEFRILHQDTMAFYSGSLERTSSNIWEEDGEKGWVMWDTSSVSVDLVPMPTRSMRSYNVRSFMSDDGNPSAEDINHALSHLLEHRTADIMRLVAHDVPRLDRDRIDWSMVRKMKESCAYFEVDIRYSSDRQDHAIVMEKSSDGGGSDLVTMAMQFMVNCTEEARSLAAGYLQGGS